MNLSAPFIRRPIMTTLVMAALLLAGFLGYRSLPVSDLPNVDFPTIQVSANLPGASPDTMAASVATPLERQFMTIPGLDSINSSSALGSTQITLQFKLSRNIDAAAQDVQTAIAAASSHLPPGMPTPPTYKKVKPADQPILFLALHSDAMPLYQLDEYAENLLAQQISTVDGVAQVSVFGSQKYAVRVQVDPNALAARGIGVDEVANSIEQGNANLPTGALDGHRQAFTVQTNGQLSNAREFRQLIVTYRNGSPVRLGELGRVVDSVENDKIASWYNGTRGIVLAIQRQPGTNTVHVVDDILKQLPTLRSQIPASVQLDTLFNRSEGIRASINDVQATLMLTAVLVVTVIFLFLRNLSATVIPSLALPASIIAVFAVMPLFGFNLDNLSLMALTLSTGFVVDDAIVMLENIVRRMEHGDDRLTAALTGAKEIGFTILAMTTSLVAVFIPIFFMGGILGRLFREFSVTITIAILVSGFVSLSLTPMLASRFLKPDHEGKRNRFADALENGFEGLKALYDRGLRLVLRHPRWTLAASGVLFLVTATLFVQIPKGFLPSEDTGMIMVSTQAAPGISFEDMTRHQTELMKVVAADPNVEAFMSSVGAGGPTATSNGGRMFIRLKPRSQRHLDADGVIQELRPKLSHVPGIMAFLQNPPSIRIGGQLTKSLYQVTLQAPDTRVLYDATPKLEAALKEAPELQDVTSELLLNTPQIDVDIDRDKASALGITATQVQTALQNAYGQRQISLMLTSTDEYKVIVEALPEDQMDPSALSMLYVRSSSGKLVPLNVVATIRRDVGPIQVNHLASLPATTISFNLRPGVSLSAATERVNAVARQILPDAVTMKFQGSAQVFQDSQQGLGVLLLLSVLVIYIVLGILYESFIHPLTVLSGLPSAGLGALLALMVCGKDLGVYGFVGLIMLVGIVKKNAIILIDFAIEAQREGVPAREAIYQACLVRFRPIMMTTAAALMGTLPIALGLGAGAESRQPMGLAVLGGLLVSQMLTLFITPVIYLYMDRLQPRSRKSSGMPHKVSTAIPVDQAG